jgi:hypothetical protein
MKTDAAEAIRTQNETLVSMSLAEEKKKAARREEIATKEASTAPGAKPAPRPLGRFVIILGLIILVAGAGVAIKFALPTLRTIDLPSVSLPIFGTPATDQSTKTTGTPTSTSPTRSLIPAQSEKRFIVNRETPEHLFATIAVERTAGVAPGKIHNFYFSEETTDPAGGASTASISANRLLILANVPTPAILARSLEAPFMVGLYWEECSQATPFFIFKVSGYDTGLAGMLAWEKDLPHFFDTMFGTKFLSGPSTPAKFRNTVVLGHDVRALEGLPAGSILYTFASPSTILVAGSQSALEALLPFLLVRR